MKTKIIAVVIVAGLGLMLLTQLKPLFESGKDSAKSNDPSEILKNENSNEQDIYSALHTLSRAQDPLALETALDKAEHPSRTIREGVTNALGYFIDDRAFAALVKLLSDPEENVRIRTLQALTNAKEERRVPLVLDYLRRDNLSQREVTIAQIVAYRLLPTGPEKAAIKKDLISFASSGHGLEEHIAFAKLVELEARDEDILNLVKNKIDKSTNEESVALGILHLATIKDRWLIEKAQSLFQYKSENVRSALVKTFHHFCFANNWVMMDSLLKNTKSDSVLKGLLDEAHTLGGSSGTEFIESMISSQKLNSELTALANSYLKTIPQTNLPCK